MARGSETDQGNVSKGIDFKRMMLDGTYADVVGGYQSYVIRQVFRVRRHYKGGAGLSVGCGNGDIESMLPFPVVCYDIHDAAKVLHPELDFRYSWPSEKFDLTLCLGAVMSYIEPSEQQNFVDKLICSTKETGSIIMTGIGHSGHQDDPVYPIVAYPSHPRIKVLS